MIKVIIGIEPDRGIKRFSITGHACFSEYGSDIVCSAVSAVAQTAVIGLQHYLGPAVEFKKTQGSLSCCVSDLEPGQKEISEAILKTMYWGLRAIEAQYEEHIRLIIEGGGVLE